MSDAQEVTEQPKTASSVVTSENLADFNADKLGLASESSPTAAEVDENPSSASGNQQLPGLLQRE